MPSLVDGHGRKLMFAARRAGWLVSGLSNVGSSELLATSQSRQCSSHNPCMQLVNLIHLAYAAKRFKRLGYLKERIWSWPFLAKES